MPPLTDVTAEQLRSGAYMLLAHLLAAAPDAELLARLRAATTTAAPDAALTAAWAGLQQAAEQAQPEALALEFQDLFIGLGRGELIPYGSWYQTGSLMERPLGELRRDLAALGYERGEGVREPEDHAAALCEIMALLVLDETVPPEAQRRFFNTHVGSWLDAFFRDLESAQGARFYRAVGRLGSAFITLEQRYLSMLA